MTFDGILNRYMKMKEDEHRQRQGENDDDERAPVACQRTPRKIMTTLAATIISFISVCFRVAIDSRR